MAYIADTWHLEQKIDEYTLPLKIWKVNLNLRAKDGYILHDQSFIPATTSLLANVIAILVATNKYNTPVLKYYIESVNCQEFVIPDYKITVTKE